MSNPTLARTIAGITIISVGIIAAIGSLNIANVADAAATWWPVLLIIAGITIAISDTNNRLWAGLVGLVGAVLLYNSLTDSSVNVFALFWPLIIILFGVSLVRGRTRITRTVTGTDNHFVLMSGIEARNAAKDYAGGKITAIMGGVELDLRDAVIKDEAVLEVLAVMGGIELRVPREWTVRSDVMTLLGGVDNKTSAPDAKGPVLTLVGTVLMGGVEVK